MLKDVEKDAPATSNNAGGRNKALTNELVRIAFEDLNRINLQEEYTQIKESLSIGEKATKPSEVLRALDRSTEIANTAAKIAIIANYLLDLNKLELESAKAALQAKAEACLSDAKDKGELKGQVSEAKIERYILNDKLLGPQFIELKEKDVKLSAVAKTMDALARQANDHKNILQSQSNLIDKVINFSKHGD